MKKSQVSHVFIFALGIIILSLILFFGYKVVQELRTKGDETDVIRFKTKLVNDIKVLKEGDVTIKSYIIPKSYREVCFVDNTHISDGRFPWRSEFHNDWGDNFGSNEPELANAITSEVKENVFLVGKSKVDSIFIGNIDLGLTVDIGGCPLSDNDDTLLATGACTPCPPLLDMCSPHSYAVYCFEIKNSRLNIVLEGQGDSVLIQKQE